MTDQNYRQYYNKGRQYYKDYLQGTSVHKEGYGDIYFNSGNAGKNKAHVMELYPQLKKMLKKAKLTGTSNDKGEKDRYYEHLISEYNGKMLDHIIEVILGGKKNYKMTKF